MSKNILVICDSQEDYCVMLDGYIRDHVKIPFEIYSFTDTYNLKSFELKTETSVLIISESLFKPEISDSFKNIILLSENQSSKKHFQNVKIVNKFQSTELILKEIFDICIDSDMILYDMEKEKNLKIIGFFTPINRVLQTTSALTLGEILARKHKTLYINFEYASGFEYIMDDCFEENLSDLMYYFECYEDKFTIYLDRIKKCVNNLDFVPPVSLGEQIRTTTISQWIKFFKKINEKTEYEYLILDITENVDEVMKMLDVCDRIYMISGHDRIANSKLVQFEKCISRPELESLKEKIKRIDFPIFKRLPTKANLYMESDVNYFLREYIKGDKVYGHQA
ncbi:MAG: hypothetical protein K6B41_14265 [Butyrivibrio sp.]|nr:hypothetical protein [Butyrivibrio sp.]